MKFTLIYLQNDYKLSPEELALFKDLPINELWLGDLDIKPENILQFRKVLMEMKITYLGKPFQSYHIVFSIMDPTVYIKLSKDFLDLPGGPIN